MLMIELTPQSREKRWRLISGAVLVQGEGDIPVRQPLLLEDTRQSPDLTQKLARWTGADPDKYSTPNIS